MMVDKLIKKYVKLLLFFVCAFLSAGQSFADDGVNTFTLNFSKDFLNLISGTGAYQDFWNLRLSMVDKPRGICCTPGSDGLCKDSNGYNYIPYNIIDGEIVESGECELYGKFINKGEIKIAEIDGKKPDFSSLLNSFDNSSINVNLQYTENGETKSIPWTNDTTFPSGITTFNLVGVPGGISTSVVNLPLSGGDWVSYSDMSYDGKDQTTKCPSAKVTLDVWNRKYPSTEDNISEVRYIAAYNTDTGYLQTGDDNYDCAIIFEDPDGFCRIKFWTSSNASDNPGYFNSAYGYHNELYDYWDRAPVIDCNKQYSRTHYKSRSCYTYIENGVEKEVCENKDYHTDYYTVAIALNSGMGLLLTADKMRGAGYSNWLTLTYETDIGNSKVMPHDNGLLTTLLALKRLGNKAGLSFYGVKQLTYNNCAKYEGGHVTADSIGCSPIKGLTMDTETEVARGFGKTFWNSNGDMQAKTNEILSAARNMSKRGVSGDWGFTELPTSGLNVYYDSSCSGSDNFVLGGCAGVGLRCPMTKMAWSGHCGDPCYETGMRSVNGCIATKQTCEDIDPRAFPTTQIEYPTRMLQGTCACPRGDFTTGINSLMKKPVCTVSVPSQNRSSDIVDDCTKDDWNNGTCNPSRVRYLSCGDPRDSHMELADGSKTKHVILAVESSPHGKIRPAGEPVDATKWTTYRYDESRYRDNCTGFDADGTPQGCAGLHCKCVAGYETYHGYCVLPCGTGQQRVWTGGDNDESECVSTSMCNSTSNAAFDPNCLNPNGTTTCVKKYCRCKSGYIAVGNACQKVSNYTCPANSSQSQNCTRAEHVNDVLGGCVSAGCQCNPGFVNQNGACVEYSGLNCPAINSVVVTDDGAPHCGCKEGFTDVNGECLLQCISQSDCGPGGTCSYGVCQTTCDADSVSEYDAKSGKCVCSDSRATSVSGRCFVDLCDHTYYSQDVELAQVTVDFYNNLTPVGYIRVSQMYLVKPANWGGNYCARIVKSKDVSNNLTWVYQDGNIPFPILLADRNHYELSRDDYDHEKYNFHVIHVPGTGMKFDDQNITKIGVFGDFYSADIYTSMYNLVVNKNNGTTPCVVKGIYVRDRDLNDHQEVIKANGERVLLTPNLSGGLELVYEEPDRCGYANATHVGNCPRGSSGCVDNHWQCEDGYTPVWQKTCIPPENTQYIDWW